MCIDIMQTLAWTQQSSLPDEAFRGHVRLLEIVHAAVARQLDDDLSPRRLIDNAGGSYVYSVSAYIHFFSRTVYLHQVQQISS